MGRVLELVVGAFTAPGFQSGRALGVSLLAFDPAAPSFVIVDTLPLSEDPSWILAASQRPVVYAAMHTSVFEGELGGAIVSLAVDAHAGGLRRLNARPVPFPHPTHLSFSTDERFLFAASGMGAGVSVFPISDDGGVGDATCIVEQAGAALVPFGRISRLLPPIHSAGTSYPHAIVPTPDGRYVLVADLARDAIDVYDVEASTGRLTKRRVVGLHVGAGPRMLAFDRHRPTLYAVNQSDSTLSAMRYDAGSGDLKEDAVVSTVGSGAHDANLPAAVAVHPSGRLLFVSNRGSDTVAGFMLDARAAPTLLHLTPSIRGAPATRVGGSASPRHLALTADGDWLFVSNTAADDVTAFAVDSDTGALTAVTSVAVPTPTCVAFVGALP